MRRQRFSLAVLLPLFLALVIQAQTPSALPVEIRIPVQPWAFRGSDGKSHLCYEAAITNMDRKGRKLTLNRIEVFNDSKPGSSLGSFTGPELEKMLLRPGLTENGASPRTIG